MSRKAAKAGVNALALAAAMRVHTPAGSFAARGAGAMARAKCHSEKSSDLSGTAG
jgi:hypothetical protein